MLYLIYVANPPKLLGANTGQMMRTGPLRTREFALTGTGSCVCFNLRKTTRAVTQFYDAALQPSHIRSTQLAILIGVAKAEPVSIAELAHTLIIDPTALTRSLRLLRQYGFLSISERSTMRQRFITVLPRGWKALSRGLRLWSEAQAVLVGQIGEPYWKSLQGELQKLAHIAVGLRGQLKRYRSDA